jgi:Outer membrane protein beta-barrel domain
VRARLLTASLLLLAAVAARGQSVEITPVVGYRFGGSLAATIGDAGFADYDVEDAVAFGAQLGFQVARDGEIEVLYSRQNTRLATGGLFTGTPVFDLALETWHAGGNYLFGEEDARVRPYIGMGLGVTRLLPKPAGLQDETRFSASFAAGAKVWLGRHVGLRVEARGFFTFLESDRETFCQTGEGCQVHAEGSEISQGEARVGLVLRF